MSKDTSTEEKIEIKFSCSHCQQHISTGVETAGVEAQCPACGGAIVVPDIATEDNQESLDNRNHRKLKYSRSFKLVSIGAATVVIAGGIFIISSKKEATRPMDQKSPNKEKLESSHNDNSFKPTLTNNGNSAKEELEADSKFKLKVPLHFPFDYSTKLTLNNIVMSDTDYRMNNEKSSPAGKSLCELYYRGYYFPNTITALRKAGYPGFRRLANSDRYPKSHYKMYRYLLVGALDEGDRKTPRWRPNDSLPELTRAQIYEKYYGFKVTEEHVQATNIFREYLDGQNGKLTLKHDPFISDREVRSFLIAFDTFKNKYLKLENPRPPGASLWK